MSAPESGIGRSILLKGRKGLLQIQFTKTDDSLCAAVYIQLAIDMLNVNLNSASGKKQLLGNRII